MASAPPRARSAAPARGKRNANATRPRFGLHAARSASPSAATKTGRRSRDAGGNPTEKTAKNPAAVEARSRSRAAPPGRRGGWSFTRASSPVVLLERRHPRRLFLARADAFDGRRRRGERRDARDREAQRGGPDRRLVEPRLSSQRRVDHELDLPRLHAVHGAGAALVDLED